MQVHWHIGCNIELSIKPWMNMRCHLMHRSFFVILSIFDVPLVSRRGKILLTSNLYRMVCNMDEYIITFTFGNVLRDIFSCYTIQCNCDVNFDLIRIFYITFWGLNTCSNFLLLTYLYHFHASISYLQSFYCKERLMSFTLNYFKSSLVSHA